MTTLPNRLINEFDAAELLGLKAATLRRWRWSGTGPRWCKVGGAVRYRERDVDAFVQASLVGTAVQLGVR